MPTYEEAVDMYDGMDWYERQVWRAYAAVRSGNYVLAHIWWVLDDVRGLLR